jgi:hypothetical protein
MTNFQDYSYLLVGFYDIETKGNNQTFKATQGTCFFVRKNKKLFLVSAKHVLTSWDPDTSKKRNSYPKNLNLRLFDNSNNPIFVSINIEDLSKEITGAFTHNDPDLYVMEFEDDPKYKINSIEKFIDESFAIKSSDKVQLYGYPVDYNFFGEKQTSLLPTLKPTLIEGVPLPMDSIYRNEKIKQLENLNFAIEHQHVAIRQGCSGAPAFAKSEEKWSFCGIFINASPEVPVSLILKKDYLFCKLS